MKVIPFEELYSEGELEKWRPQDSEVKRDKNQKAISVSNTLDHNRIRLKVIAPYRKWVEWQESYMEQSPGTWLCALPCLGLSLMCLTGWGRKPRPRPPFDLGAILPYIGKRTRKVDIEALKLYYRADPWGFINEFFSRYICPANAENPEYRRKCRGGSPYAANPFYTPQLMQGARWLAQHLYVLLEHWLKQPQDTWPPEIERLCIISDDPRGAVKELIERFLGFELGMSTSPDLELWEDTFYKAYIGKSTLPRIRRYYQEMDYTLTKTGGDPSIPFISWDELARRKKPA